MYVGKLSMGGLAVMFRRHFANRERGAATRIRCNYLLGGYDCCSSAETAQRKHEQEHASAIAAVLHNKSVLGTTKGHFSALCHYAIEHNFDVLEDIAISRQNHNDYRSMLRGSGRPSTQVAI